jgi:hypothetical protein
LSDLRTWTCRRLFFFPLDLLMTTKLFIVILLPSDWLRLCFFLPGLLATTGPFGLGRHFLQLL